uniref:MARVEL domain-containing protein n=1 Tax=Panagrellus redivivus TaxID=6233 RepID=A0A7E4ZXE5_PANRE
MSNTKSNPLQSPASQASQAPASTAAPPSQALSSADKLGDQEAGGHAAVVKKGVTELKTGYFGQTLGISNHLFIAIFGVINVVMGIYYWSLTFDGDGLGRGLYIVLSLTLIVVSFSVKKMVASAIVSALVCMWTLDGLVALKLTLYAIALTAIKVPCNPDDLDNQDVSCKLGVAAPWIGFDIGWFFPYSFIKAAIIVFYVLALFSQKKEWDAKKSMKEEKRSSASSR